jgi:hypothetical protein
MREWGGRLCAPPILRSSTAPELPGGNRGADAVILMYGAPVGVG